ncbi:MAG: hypothetical protein ABSE77_20595 [Acidimicrobiales bacterium]
MSGRVSKGAELPAGSAVISYGRGVYVIGPTKLSPDGGAVGPYVLRPVRTSDLSVGRPVPLLPACPTCYQFPSAFQPTGPHRGDLWVAAGAELRLVRPSTGAVVARVALTGTGGASGLAVEPDGRYLDVSTSSVAEGKYIGVLELSASNGTVVKRLVMPPAIVPPQLVAVPGGLWLSRRSGNAGTANFFREGSLKGRFYRRSLDARRAAPPRRRHDDGRPGDEGRRPCNFDQRCRGHLCPGDGGQSARLHYVREQRPLKFS